MKMLQSKFLSNTLLMALLPAWLASGGAWAANACFTQQDGVGGTGASVAGKGIGGTGVTAHDGGIGGTGATSGGEGIGGTGATAHDGGIGGTGIVGIITGFASICVNGMEVHYSQDTPLEIGGHPAKAKDLAVGQLVVAEVAGAGDEVVARNISVQYAVLGPVTAVNASRGQVQVMGQPVQITAQTVTGAGGEMTSLHAGDFVRVSGLRKQDGGIVAARIERVPAQNEVSVSGPVRGVGEHDFSISGLSIAPADESLPMNIAAGREVSVTGYLQDGVLQARKIDVTPAVPFGGHLRRLELQGYVRESLTAGKIRVGQTELELSPQAMVTGKLAPDQLVRISARLTADDRLLVERIEVTHDYFVERGEALGMDRKNARHGAKENEKEDTKVRTEKLEKNEEENSGVRPEKLEKSDKHERSERVERMERIERVERIELPDRPEHD